ncbi:MAG TPA: lysophospholipid acyltransferase family protein [Pyrinomonadaceae bacterium]|nr:lysophospholipid acyltransferase family protein [Pyrinomonadaceae bacterium]
MTRRIITALLGVALRVFFRRVEVAGRERVPATGALVFVLNHPNALVDPVFLLCLAPRPVSFLAKSTLFRMPVLSFFVRALDAIPVYRKQDAGEDTSRNRETFERARHLLARGGTIGVCPEGVSHNEPSLKPFKSGASRIALGAVSSGGGNLELKIVPAGLYYTAKTTFRSSALLYFGDPVPVEPVELDERGEPPAEAVRDLNARIERALREVTLNAEHAEALSTIARAERIFSAEEDDTETPRAESYSLARELRLRRRFVEGYAFLREREPERLAALEARIRQYEEELRQAGFEDPRDLSTSALSRRAATRHLVARSLLFLLLSPVALFGLLLHYPAYRLAGFLSVKFSGNYDDVISTIKIIAAMLLFPLTWAALAAVSWVYVGWWAGLLAALLVPPAGFVALRFSEEFESFVGSLRALAFFAAERRFFRRLLQERKAIRREILNLADEAARAGALKSGA